MPKKRECRAVGVEYFDTAPVRGVLRQEIPASAAATFASLKDPEAWPQWLSAITQVVWTSPEPFGVGTTRDVTGRGMAISEYFFDWEEGRRMSFYFTSSSIPVFAAFAEEYSVEPLGADSCELVWRHAFESPNRLRFTQPVAGRAFKRTGAKALVRLAAYMEANKQRYEGDAET